MAGRVKKRTGIGVIIFIVLCFCAIIMYSKTGLEKIRDNKEAKIEELNTRVDEQIERANDIRNLEAYVQTKKYIEEVAREKLGLVYEHDIIFEPKE